MSFKICNQGILLQSKHFFIRKISQLTVFFLQYKPCHWRMRALIVNQIIAVCLCKEIVIIFCFIIIFFTDKERYVLYKDNILYILWMNCEWTNKSRIERKKILSFINKTRTELMTSDSMRSTLELFSFNSHFCHV